MLRFSTLLLQLLESSLLIAQSADGGNFVKSFGLNFKLFNIIQQ
jgi:hypothetical protein